MSDNYDGPQMAQKILRQQTEIERLRDHVKFLNSFRPDAELAKRDAEIERLRDAAVIARTTEANLHEEIERLHQENKEMRLEMRSLLQVTVGTLSDIEIQRDYGMLGWSVIKRCEKVVR